MILKSLKLRNIRSYSDAHIDFPSGPTLLSGDIGTGKSTLLMAVDFALFGIRRADMSGSDLLRHGSDSGEIELSFDVDGNDVLVRRTLRRKKDSVNQESGLLAVNGVRQELTASEITARILEMIGYPSEVLRKNRPIFRYTVYTPQEQMKHIIENDDRLETLRKIFGIDKYGLIKANALVLRAFLREEKRGLEGYALDLVQKKADREARLIEKQELLTQLENHAAALEELDRRIAEKKDALEQARMRVNEVTMARKEAENKKAEIAAMKSRMERNAKSIAQISERVVQKKTLAAKYAAAPKPDMGSEEIRKALEQAEAERESLLDLRTRAASRLDNMDRIYRHGICEVCGQPVHDRESFAASMIKSRAELEKLGSSAQETAGIIAVLRKKQIDSREYETLLEKKAAAEDEIQELEERLNALEKENREIQLSVSEAEKHIIEVPDSAAYEKALRKAESEYNEVHLSYVAESRMKAAAEARILDAERFIHELDEEISRKEEALRKVSTLAQTTDWIDSKFLPLIDFMERNVMLSIQQEFGAHFQKWFSMLVDDALSVRIDEGFAPLIEQNGYETEYRNLSGGEKTSVALAYRLALNRVINDMVHTIKTKDIMILDEPTDGFSSEQLDKLRDVLKELALKQVIIVSHEPKIDTYVDNVIRIYKEEGHLSRVAV